MTWTDHRHKLGPYLLRHPARPSTSFSERVMECIRLSLRCRWQNQHGCQKSHLRIRTAVAILRGKILINS